MQNRGTGAGGKRTNENGLNFEDRVLKCFCIFIKKNGYKLEALDKKYQSGKSKSFRIVNNKDEKIALLGTQNSLFKYLNNTDQWVPNGVAPPSENIKNIWSKDLKPDLYIFDLRGHLVTIFEIKYQQESGSVDEKIQTGPFKKQMWEKLFRSFKIKINYEYILATKKFWEQKSKNKISKPVKYKDVYQWLKQHKIKYHITDIEPTMSLELTDYILKNKK